MRKCSENAPAGLSYSGWALCFPVWRVLLCLAFVSLLSSCASHVKAPDGGLAELPLQEKGIKSDLGADASNAGPGEKFDPVEDELICKETLKAWRVAIAHDDKEGEESEWLEQRKQDEEKAMDALEKLALAHPNSSYIKTMMGQVKQHFGKKSEAAAYYEESSLQNRRDPVLIFKAAEMRRKNGELKRARTYYERVLGLSANFSEAKLGLAHCLLGAPENKQDKLKAKKLLDEVLAADPENTEAKEMLAAMGSPQEKSAGK